MRVFIFSVVLACIGAVVSPNLGNAHSQDVQQKDGKAKELKVGDTAPDWKMKGSDGKVYRLSQYKGKQAVVVSWYPMALTGG